MFICKYCKCEFIMDKDEYNKCCIQGEDVMLYVVSCPCCKKYIKKYILVSQKPSN